MRCKAYRNTSLWMLRCRATEAQRPDRIIDDPWAVSFPTPSNTTTRSSGGPFRLTRFARSCTTSRRRLTSRASWGKRRCTGRGHADQFLAAGPNGLVERITLGIPWTSHPLSHCVSDFFRRMPVSRTPEVGTLDRSWMDDIDHSRGVFITAEGLFMYLRRDEVLALIADCAERFPAVR